MIKKLPIIYPNESFSSYLSRLYCHSGYIWHMGLALEIFKRPNEYVNYNFLNILNDDFLKVLEQYISLEEIITKHTLFNYYARFLELKKRKRAFSIATANTDSCFQASLPLPRQRNFNHLRYCPACVTSDREQYGECFFHIEHQIPEIHCCPLHGIKLIDTKIDNSKSHDSTLLPLEAIVDSMETVKASDIEIRLAKYIYESFQINLDLHNDYKIGQFLVEKLDDKYFSPRGEQKDLNKIFDDISTFYKDLPSYNLTKARLATIYRDEYLNVFNIYLIGLFEKISITDLCFFKNAKQTRWELFDQKVRELSRERKTQAQIANILKVNHEVIRQVLIGTYDKAKDSSARFKCKKWDWERIDNECCAKLDEVIKKLKNKNLPITRKNVAMELGLKDKTFRNLPKLKKSLIIKRTV